MLSSRVDMLPYGVLSQGKDGGNIVKNTRCPGLCYCEVHRDNLLKNCSVDEAGLFRPLALLGYCSSLSYSYVLPVSGLA